jgi:hypothetical protein
MQPSEFWRLPLFDFWTELDSKIEEVNKLKEMTEGKVKPKGIATAAQWEEGRRRHREKMAVR